MAIVAIKQADDKTFDQSKLFYRSPISVGFFSLGPMLPFLTVGRRWFLEKKCELGISATTKSQFSQGLLIPNNVTPQSVHRLHLSKGTSGSIYEVQDALSHPLCIPKFSSESTQTYSNQCFCQLGFFVNPNDHELLVQDLDWTHVTRVPWRPSQSCADPPGGPWLVQLGG